MTQWNLGAIANGTVTSSSSTEVKITGTDNLFYDITGTGLTLNGSNKFTGGTITGFGLSDNLAHTYYAVSDFSLSAATYQGYLNANDQASFFSAVFGSTDTITGSIGNDVLEGFQGADSINGSGGDDRLIGDAGNDTLNGGSGRDIADYSKATSGVTGNLAISGQQAIGGGQGSDTLVSIEDLWGSQFSDTLTGNSGNNRIVGQAGNDKIYLTDGGTDVTDGGIGNDSFYFDAAFKGVDTVTGGTGLDTLYLNGDYSVGVNLAHVTGIERIILGAGFDYRLTTSDPGDGIGTAIDGSALNAAHSLILDGKQSFNNLDITGGAGDDNVIGGSGDDTFHMALGGADRVDGRGGNDTIVFATAFDSSDHIDGGGGVDTLRLRQDMTLVVGAGNSQIVNVEVFQLESGANYNVSAHGNAGTAYTIDASDLLATDTFAFDDSGSIANGATFTVLAGAEADTLTDSMTSGNNIFDSGAGNDVITASNATNTIRGGDGNDTINLNAARGGNADGGTGRDTFNVIDGYTGNITGGVGNDRFNEGHLAGNLDGGNGTDTLALTSGGTSTLSFDNFKNIEVIQVSGAHNFTIAGNDGEGPVLGSTLTVDATHLTAGNSLDFEGQNFDTQGLIVSGGAGADTIFGAASADTLRGFGSQDLLAGLGGHDTLTGGGNKDQFYYSGVSDSSDSSNYDAITDFVSGTDQIRLLGTSVGGIDTTVTTGALTTANFNSDLAAAIGAGQLAAGHAVLFKPSTGDTGHDTYLVVDADGTAGYQAGADYVIAVDGVNHITTADFLH